MTRYLRRGCGGLDRRLHLRARGTRPPAFEAVEGSSGRAMAIGASQPRVSPGCMRPRRHGVNIFVSASYVGTGCRRAGPPPKAGPAQAAVDSATEAPESGWFLAYSSSLGRRVIGEIIPESCIHLCEEPPCVLEPGFSYFFLFAKKNAQTHKTCDRDISTIDVSEALSCANRKRRETPAHVQERESVHTANWSCTSVRWGLFIERRNAQLGQQICSRDLPPAPIPPDDAPGKVGIQTGSSQGSVQLWPV